MENERVLINFNENHRGINSYTFTGRPQGEQVRISLELDAKDKTTEKYKIAIPEETVSFNPSFYLGLFFQSIKNLKGYSSFKEKYKIILLEKNPELKEGIKKDLYECERQAKNEFKNKTGLSGLFS